MSEKQLIPVKLIQFEVLRNPGTDDVLGRALSIVALDNTGQLWKCLDVGVFNSWTRILGPQIQQES